MSSLIVKICRVDNVVKHPNADRLSIAQVGGWNCIIGLDQYKEGDKVVFVPPDCIIPQDLIEKYNLEYLRSNGRTGTVKLRGYISQGLILDLPEGNWKVGDDVSSVLGITKYEPPEPKYSVRSGNQVSKKKLNPLFDKYTDIENIKNYGNVFNENDFVVVTEKIHGANSRFASLPIVYNKALPLIEKLRYFWNKYIKKQNYEFVYGSHNIQLTSSTKNKNYYGDDVWGKMAKKYDLINHIEPNMIIYGEIYGNGIQDLTYGLQDIDLVIFDIKKDGKYMDWDFVADFCSKHNLKHVPVIAHNEQFSKDKLSEWTSGNSLLCPSQIREGCVVKMYEEQNNPLIGRTILKSINNEYLIRKNGTEYK